MAYGCAWAVARIYLNFPIQGHQYFIQGFFQNVQRSPLIVRTPYASGEEGVACEYNPLFFEPPAQSAHGMAGGEEGSGLEAPHFHAAAILGIDVWGHRFCLEAQVGIARVVTFYALYLVVIHIDWYAVALHAVLHPQHVVHVGVGKQYDAGFQPLLLYEVVEYLPFPAAGTAGIYDCAGLRIAVASQKSVLLKYIEYEFVYLNHQFFTLIMQKYKKSCNFVYLLINRLMHIAIAGNIGSGKTTLTKMLSAHYGWTPKFEPVDFNPYLADFYEDMERWSFNLQIYFLNKRFKDVVEIKKHDDVVIQDRTIYEDAHIFAPNLHDMGLMSTRDFENYNDLFNLMMSLVGAPDLLIYLRSSIPNLIAQIQKRGREYEKSIRIDYITGLNEKYENWIASYKDNLLILDVDRIKFENNPEFFREVTDKIDAKLFGLFKDLE